MDPHPGACCTFVLPETFTYPSQPTFEKLSLDELKRKVIQMCSRIFRVLGPGFREQCYQKALETELNSESIKYLSQAPVPIYYKETVIAMGYADIIVDDRLILELKATKTNVLPGHLNQCRGYMRASGIKNGLVINFPQYKPRSADIDVYDCDLGNRIDVNVAEELSENDILHADNNEMGPASLFKNDPIDPYENHQMQVESEDGIQGSFFGSSFQMNLPPSKRFTTEISPELKSWFE